MRSMAPADTETVEAVEGCYLTQLVVGDRMSIQHFHIEPGATVPRHSHEHEQCGFVVNGSLTFLLDDEEHVIHPGESYVLPSDEEHGAENRSETPVEGIDIFGPPRADPPWATE